MQFSKSYLLKAAICYINDSDNCKGPIVNGHINDACYLFYFIVDPQANVAPGMPEAAICVQVIAAQYILQFAIVIALCCALHRFASRVIHRSEWLFKILESVKHFNTFLKWKNVLEIKQIVGATMLVLTKSFRPTDIRLWRHLPCITTGNRAPKNSQVPGVNQVRTHLYKQPTTAICCASVKNVRKHKMHDDIPE